MKTDVAMRLRCQPVSQASGTVNTPMTTGIITMRSQVRRFGTLSGMELPVDLLGELAADALDLRQVLHARAHDPFQSSEPRAQLLAPVRRTERGHGRERGGPDAGR